MSESVQLEVDAGIATIRLARPPMNALDIEVQEGIRRRPRKPLIVAMSPP